MLGCWLEGIYDNLWGWQRDIMFLQSSTRNIICFWRIVEASQSDVECNVHYTSKMWVERGKTWQANLSQSENFRMAGKHPSASTSYHAMVVLYTGSSWLMTGTMLTYDLTCLLLHFEIGDLEIRIIYGKAVLINAYWNAKDFAAIVLSMKQCLPTNHYFKMPVLGFPGLTDPMINRVFCLDDRVPGTMWVITTKSCTELVLAMFTVLH
jgi:hypothetical protein